MHQLNCKVKIEKQCSAETVNKIAAE